jgi:hypothetical protein
MTTYSTADIEGLLSRITQGEWWFDDYCYIFAKQPSGDCYPMIADYDTDEAYLLRMRGVGAGLVENGQQKVNAEFIAAAPTIVRQLLTERDTARTELAAAQARIAHLEQVINGLGDVVVGRVTPIAEVRKRIEELNATVVRS